MDAKQKRALEALALVLAGVAGGVDAIGWLTLDHLFTAHMSGNTVNLTVHVALGDWREVARRAWVIGSFLIGLGVGAAAATLAYRRRSRASFSIVLAIEAALLVAFLLLGEDLGHGGVAPRHDTAAYGVLVALAAMSMGLQSATLRRAGPARARTTYVTGVLTRMVEHAVQLAACVWDRRRGRGDRERERRTRAKLAVLAAVWLAYAAGGVTCGLLVRWIGWLALVLPVLAIATAIALDLGPARASLVEAAPEEG